MFSLHSKLRDAFAQAIAEVVPDAGEVDPAVSIADPRFGDYQCNNAMTLFKKQPRGGDGPPRWRAPRDVGVDIQNSLPQDTSEFLDEVTVAPQGFITVKLRKDWMEAELRRLASSDLRFSTVSPKRIVMDYSSPNIAKEMHVGHLRSTILGDSMASLLSFMGHDVVRLNHVGDWGTQFGMLLEYMKRQGEDAGEAQEGGSLAIRDLQAFYRKAKVAFDEDEGFRKAAQSNVVSLQSGEAWAREAWGAICAASRSEFETIYKRLRIESLEERGESFYNDLITPALVDLEAKGLVEKDGGASCIFTNVSEAPLIVQKADGGFGYDSTDVAAVLHRLREESADRVIYVIDNGQESHMRMVFEVAERADWLGDKRLDFMGFGLVQGEDGKKLKTRSGDVIRLRDLLDEAASRAETELRRRVAEREGKEELDEEAEARVKADAEQIGVAAVKYFDLRQNRNSDYRCSFDAMLDPKGNTAVYVLYAYARIAGLLRRSGRDAASLNPQALRLDMPTERALALRLLRLPEVLAQVEDDLLPSRLVDYVYGLAGDFSAFYTECPVVGSDSEESRLMLCEMTRRAMSVVLDILGIEPLERL